MLPSFFGLRWLKPWWLVRRSRRAADEIRSLLVSLIRPRHEAAAAGGDGARDDILAALLRTVDPRTGAGFSFDELVDQVAMLFLAGHETSASAMSWALHLLANRPDVQDRLHAEAARHLDPGSDDVGAIKDLALARNVFRETLRLFPPVGFFARQCRRTQRMRDKDVRAGSSVIVSPWLIQRHREHWARPDEFDPDRYDREDESPAARDSLRRAFLPFGMGPRVCIGASFALQESALVLGVLAREFRFEPVPGEVPEPIGRLTIRAENGIRLRVFQREKGA
jgi:cytochrome P450